MKEIFPCGMRKVVGAEFDKFDEFDKVAQNGASPANASACADRIPASVLLQKGIRIALDSFKPGKAFNDQICLPR